MTSIVVADDEADILDSMQLVLAMEGFGVTTVQDPKLILATLRRVRPDILLQDINMPGLDIAKHIRDVRADPKLKGLRILVFTASVDSEAINQALATDSFVQKPFDANRIKETLDRHMAKKAKGGA